MIQSFKDILAWQKAHDVVKEVYRLTKGYPKEELFVLVSQSRRCAISIPSNIAEGFRREGVQDSLHFYNMAQASLEELRYQIFLANDLQYISDVDYQSVKTVLEEASKTLNGWTKSQRQRS